MGVIHIENDLNCIWISNPIATDKSIQGMGHELALSEVTGELMERNRSRSVINNIDNQSFPCHWTELLLVRRPQSCEAISVVRKTCCAALGRTVICYFAEM